MATASAHIPLSRPAATALLSRAPRDRRNGFSSSLWVADGRWRHCYQPTLINSSSLLQGPCCAGCRPLPLVARERRYLETSLFPPPRLGNQARIANPRKKLSRLAPLQGNWTWKEGGEDVSETERPNMAGRLADTGPPSTSAPTRFLASQQGYLNHRNLGFRCRSAFSQGKSRFAGVAFPGWGEEGEQALRVCQALAARKTATFESAAEVDFRALEEVAERPAVGNGAPRRARIRRTVIDGEERVQSEPTSMVVEEIKGADLGACADGSPNGGDLNGVNEVGVNGVNVNGAPKRRRRGVATEDETKAKRSMVRRRRTSKVVEAEIQTEDVDSGASDSDSEVLAAVGSANGASLTGTKVAGAGETSTVANRAIATEPGLNRRKKAVRRRKGGETDSEEESWAVAREGKELESDGEVEGLESGVNGQKRPVRRRRRIAKEALTSDAETDGLRSSDEESDSFSDAQNGRGSALAPRNRSARGRTFGENGGASDEDAEPLDGEIEYRSPPSQLASAPIPSKPLLPPPKPTRTAAEPRSRDPKSPAGFVKEKLRQGLAVVSGNSGTDGEIDNSIDPHRLVRGELVVHKRVGIGRFRELRTEKVEGRAQPVLFVYLEYADGLAKLPAHQAHRLLYRYRSPGIEGKEPGLSKLKDRRAWERRKSKGRAHIQKMVINILKLYRLRAAVSRPPYPPDGEAQARFEATFKFEPTEHQQQAFDAVRDDMCNRTVPMDRIVCGDVGFGKTEVALRAVFRAAKAGRQVAVLAPTTVLAKQHYDVIQERFKDFPEIVVTMLSRLAGEKEKRAGLEGIANGQVDVAVGTHALLGESVRFLNLGLLVVDEEQRFGVRQKEKMKNMKTEIDVLTLSATPIPRTLEQATRGLKDLSLITTPPPSRRPIKTHLQQFDEKLVEWAIEQELARGGQVYYIVPRIHGGNGAYAQSIIDVQGDLKRKMPDVTIDMAHGQMSGPELERAMRAFRAGETQILLCTSIVESGLDIPNCNTIIITEVEKFGLAQIYQLRGRVGRSNVEAHAYLLYAVGNREDLSPPAELRLQALEECVDLGAGVHVAQRDLTIRGTGEVFGEKQSGKLSTEIGADLFNEMLFDSLYRAQTETLPKVHFDDVKVDFVVDTLVPHDYIDCTEGRDQFLEDMEKAARGGVESANEFYLEMEERLGPPPQGAKRRLQMLVMKRLAADLGITRIRTRPKFILFETSMSIGAFQMLFDAIDEEKAVDIKNNLIYKEGSAGFLLKSLLGLPPEKEAQDAFECLMEMSKGLDSFMNMDRSADS